MLSVQHSVGEPIPEFAQAPEEGAKVPSFVRGQNAGDILPYDPAGAEAISKPEIFEGQVATVVGHSLSEPGDAEGLTGRSSDKKLNCIMVSRLYLREIAPQRHVRVPMLQHRARERFDFRKESRPPSERRPRFGRGLDAGTDGPEDHAPLPKSRPD